MKKETRKKGRLASRALSMTLAVLMAFSSSVSDIGSLNVKAAELKDKSVYEQTLDTDKYEEIVFDDDFVIGDFDAENDDTSPSSGELEEFDLNGVTHLKDPVTPNVTSVEELTSTNLVPQKYSQGHFTKGSGWAYVDGNYINLPSTVVSNEYKLLTSSSGVVDIYDNFEYKGKKYDVRYEFTDLGQKASTVLSLSGKKPEGEESSFSWSGRKLLVNKLEAPAGQEFNYKTVVDNYFTTDMRLYQTAIRINSGGYFGIRLQKNTLCANAGVTVKVTFYPSGTLKSYSTNPTCDATPATVDGWCIFSDLDYKEGVYLGAGFDKGYVWGTDEETKWGVVKNYADGDEEDPLVKGEVTSPKSTSTQKTILKCTSGGWITNSDDKKHSTEGNAGYRSQCAYATFSGSSITYTYRTGCDSKGTNCSIGANTGSTYKWVQWEHDGAWEKATFPFYNDTGWGSTLYSLDPNEIKVTYYVNDIKVDERYYIPYMEISIPYVKDFEPSAVMTDGWYTESGKKGTKVAEGSTYSLADKDVNFYGYTTSPSVTYVPNFTVGGKNYATPATNQVDNITTANITTRANTTFKITGNATYTTYGEPWVLNKWMTAPSTEGGYAAQAKGSGEVNCSSAYTVTDLTKGQTFYGQYKPRIVCEGEKCTVKFNGGTNLNNVVDYNSDISISIVPNDKCVLQSVKKVDMLTGESIPVTLNSLTLTDKATGAYYYKIVYSESDPFAVKKHVYNSANQEIDKQPVELGEVITYTLTVGNKTMAARGGVLTDSIPAGTTLVEGSISDGGTVSNGVISWNLSLPAGPCDINGQTGDISGSGVKTVSFKVKINDNCVDKQVIENFAKMHPTPLATDSSNLEDAESNHVHNYVADQFNKDHFNKKAFNLNNEDISDGVVRAGEEFRYEITVFNPCPQATTIDIVDTLPDGVDYISCSDSGVYTSGAGPLGQNQVKWSAISVPAEGTKTVSISVKMNEDIEGGIYVNEAVYKWTKNVDFSNPVYVTVYGLKNPKKYVYLVEDVTIDDYVFDDTKNQDGKIIGVGQLLTYRLTWSNPTVSERTINIEDTLPDGVRIATEEDYFKYLRGEELDKTANAADGYLISDGGTYDSATNKVTWSFTSKGDVIANDNGSVLFTVVVLDEAKNKKIENFGTVEVATPQGINEAHLIADTNVVVNYAIKPDKRAYRTELIAGGNVEKDVTDKVVSDGDILKYKITIDNPAEVAKEFTVKDKVPTFTKYIDGSASDGGVYSSADNEVTWVFDLEPGEQKIVSFEVEVLEDAKDNSVKNKAEVIVDDVTVGSKIAEILVPADPTKAVLNADGKDINGIVKQAGDVITYYITYHNPSTSELEITVTDALPKDTEFVSASIIGPYDENTVTVPASAEGKYTYDSQTHTIKWTIPTSGKCYATAVVQVKILNSAKGKTLVNKALVHFPDTDKETNEVYTPVIDNPIKTASDEDGNNLNKQMVSVGQKIIYTVTCKNPSEIDTKIGKMVDILPEGVDFVSADGSYTYDEATRTVTWANITMPPTATATRTVTVVVNDKAKSMTIKNEVVYYVDDAQASSSIEDGGPGGPKVYVTSKEVLDASGNDIDREIVKVDNELTYKIKYRNLHDTERTIRILDNLPDHVAVVSISDNGQLAKNASVNGFDGVTIDDNTIYWEIKAAARYEGYVTVKVKVLKGAEDTILRNSAKLMVDDYTTTTNEVENPVTPNPVKLVFNENGTEITNKFTTAGAKLTYKITWVNPADEAKFVTITDLLPEQVSFVSADNGGKYDSSTNMVTWTDIEVGAHQRLTVSFDVKVKDVMNVTIPNRAVLYVDHVSVTSRAKTETSTPDNPTPSDDEDTKVHVVSKRTYSVDGKDITENIVKVGDTIEYRVSFKNLTNSVRTYTVVDPLPAELDYVSAGVVPEAVSANAIKTVEGNTVTMTFNVAPGVEGYVYIRSKVNEKAVGKVISNKATIVDNGYEVTPPPADNPVLDDFTKSVQDKNGKDINYKAVKSGNKLYYHISLHNPAKKEMTFTVTDTLQKKITYVESSHNGVYDKDTRTVTWTLKLKADERVDLTLVVKTNDGNYTKPIINKAHVVVDSTEADTNEVYNYVLNPPVKRQYSGGQELPDNSKVAAGEVVTYYISYINPTNQKRKITITDKLDSLIVDRVVNISDNGRLANGTITWELTVPANSSGAVNFGVQMPNSEKENVIKNQATVEVSKDDFLKGDTTLDSNVVVVNAQPANTFVPDTPAAPETPNTPNATPSPKPKKEIVQTGYSLGDKIFSLMLDGYRWLEAHQSEE